MRAKAIEKLGEFDLIICGKQAIDGDTAQVGPGLAQRLDIPYVAYARKIGGCVDGTIRLERLMDDGYDEIEMAMPALMTVVKEINEPRVPSLKGKMKARKMQATVLTAADIGADPDQLGLQGSTTRVVRVFSPEFSAEKCMLTGTADEMVDQLLNKLDKLL
ncbi:MAG: electron transfer flavoprotein subunit beta/FixA family protein [Desulfurivibrionaceae bacterium]|nr:electron transfer flavoprotein subunit beta/FixA family protein [Desulfurivibrionaceae bacterium]